MLMMGVMMVRMAMMDVFMVLMVMKECHGGTNGDDGCNKPLTDISIVFFHYRFLHVYDKSYRNCR